MPGFPVSLFVIMGAVKNMIKHMVFDIGNVLMHWQPQRFFHDLRHHEKLCSLLFRSAEWQEYDRGACTLDDLRQAYVQAYPQHQQAICYMLDHWTQVLHPISEMNAFRADCRKRGYGIYIISNLSEDSARSLQARYQLFDELDGAVLSYQEHLLKPDPKMFSLLLSRYQLDADACLFLDDAQDNIRAALDAGMNAILVDDPHAAIMKARKLLC